MKATNCTKCGVLLGPENTYRGHVQCKSCVIQRVKKRYANNRESIAEYERVRSARKGRRMAVLQYQKDRRARNPEKYKARTAVGNALRDGKLQKKPCEVCGGPKVQAHHEDYSKPLDVKWLCFKCHREVAHGQVVTCPA